MNPQQLNVLTALFGSYGRAHFVAWVSQRRIGDWFGAATYMTETQVRRHSTNQNTAMLRRLALAGLVEQDRSRAYHKQGSWRRLRHPAWGAIQLLLEVTADLET